MRKGKQWGVGCAERREMRLIMGGSLREQVGHRLSKLGNGSPTGESQEIRLVRDGALGQVKAEST
jgi:hypothetical protein